ncbi:MAG: hypothetical protein K5924_08355 [Chloroflexi bacterium]|nr:hypothetical protein [Chloroflexota bacterium]
MGARVTVVPPDARERIVLLAQRSGAELPTDYEELMVWVAERAAEIDELPEHARTSVTALLDGIDLLHRQGLSRFVDRVRLLGGRGMLERLTEDTIVTAFLDLYDLAPGEEEQQEAAARRAPLVQISDPPEAGR